MKSKVYSCINYITTTTKPEEWEISKNNPYKITSPTCRCYYYHPGIIVWQVCRSALKSGKSLTIIFKPRNCRSRWDDHFRPRGLRLRRTFSLMLYKRQFFSFYERNEWKVYRSIQAEALASRSLVNLVESVILNMSKFTTSERDPHFSICTERCRYADVHNRFLNLMSNHVILIWNVCKTLDSNSGIYHILYKYKWHIG